MSARRIAAFVAAFALLLSGCGSDKVTVTSSPASSKASSASSSASSASSSASSSAEESTSAEAETPSAPLDADACVEVTGANLDLATATDDAEAQKAADTLKKYDPPAAVGEAIDHFVSTKGAQVDDPDFKKYNDLIDGWAKQVCP